METNYLLRGADGREYPIQATTRIGRDPDCQLVLDDAATSRHHATAWVEGDTLYLADENSANGVSLNGKRIPPAKPQRLRHGDKLLLGKSEFKVVAAKAASSPADSSRRFTCLTCAAIAGGLVLLGLILVPLAYFGLGWRLPTPSTSVVQNLSPAVPSPSPAATGTLASTPPQVSVVETSASTLLLKPQEYVASSEELARAVGELNQAEVEFVRAAKGASGYGAKSVLARLLLSAAQANALDEKLLAVAADALEVAAIADRLHLSAAVQDAGSENAGQVAGQYKSIAELAAALVIEAQNMREGLAKGDITPLSAAATIVEYGARLWNPAVTDSATSGNPFVSFLADPAGVPSAQPLTAQAAAQLTTRLGTSPVGWVATSSEKVTKKLSIPNPGAANVNANDPAALAKLATVEGQTDANAARQVAASIIQAGGGVDVSGEQPSGGQIVASFWSAVAVASPNASGASAQILPAFPGGAANAVNQSPAGDVVSSLIALGKGNDPTVVDQTPVEETRPLVGLSLSNPTVTQVNKRPKGSSSFEADMLYEFDVQWQSNLTAPQFELDCASGNHFEITTASGSKHMSAKAFLILYPGAETAYCSASHNGNTWGYATLRFLVGDAAEATQRVEQVETDSVSLDRTLTAEALGTQSAEQTHAAATRISGATANAVATEVIGTQTAEFIATITEIARQTERAPTPLPTDTPTATATFTPVLLETFFHPGDVFGVSSSVVLQPGRLYRICLSGTMYMTTGPVKPSDIDHVNGIRVPVSGCIVLEGNGAVATITCGSGEPAEEPGGFSIQLFDLGPT